MSSTRNGGQDCTKRVAGLDHVRTWIFDLDNTLYPSDCNLFAQVDQRMGAFISRKLGVGFDEARRIQKGYYYEYGTTLAGLMQVHGVEPDAFLDFVHDIDLSVVSDHPELVAAIERLPGKKLVYTNGSQRHAERVCEKIGVLELFDGICSIESCGYVPKPAREAFRRMTGRHDVNPLHAAMFEDLPQNLEVPFEIGMSTVLVRSTYEDHPSQKKNVSWDTPPPHIHHMTDDLCGFLLRIDGLGGERDAAEN